MYTSMRYGMKAVKMSSIEAENMPDAMHGTIQCTDV